MKRESSVYRALLAAGCEIDHHESDLYVRCTVPAVEAIRSVLGRKARISSFYDSNGQPWIEVPFVYMPFWEARTPAASAEVKP